MKIPPDKRDASTHSEQQRRQQLSFITDQWIPFPIERVFAFLANPRNLPRLMPAWQGARIDSLELHAPENGNNPGAAGRGSRILLSFRPVPFSPIRLRWLAQIDEYVVNHHFCDLQVTGPFGYWRHCHLVSAEPHGDTKGTRITDVVDYEWLRSSANRLIEALGGRFWIGRLFRYRQQKLMQLLKEDGGT